MVVYDLLQFLPVSLELLTALLAKTSRGNFYNLHEVVAQIYPESDVEFHEQKGVFCYDYVDFVARLNVPALLLQAAFLNKLEVVVCSKVDYAYAQKVFSNFHCESLKDYMQLYLLIDISLLADVFEMFRNNSLNENQLDSAYFVSEPQLAWNAHLKHINRPIPLITDPKMYRKIQPNILGGICDASVR